MAIRYIVSDNVTHKTPLKGAMKRPH